jgi:hypothetical protein
VLFVVEQGGNDAARTWTALDGLFKPGLAAFQIEDGRQPWIYGPCDCPRSGGQATARSLRAVARRATAAVSPQAREALRRRAQPGVVAIGVRVNDTLPTAAAALRPRT